MRYNERSSNVETQFRKKRNISDDAMVVSVQSSAKKMKLNSIDPIMLTPIRKKHEYSYHRPNGTVVRFNVDTLIDFMIVSGEFFDPETRIPFSDEVLKEIDALVRWFFFGSSSVVEYFTSAYLTEPIYLY
jgi:hypothetical protein